MHTITIDYPVQHDKLEPVSMWFEQLAALLAQGCPRPCPTPYSSGSLSETGPNRPLKDHAVWTRNRPKPVLPFTDTKQPRGGLYGSDHYVRRFAHSIPVATTTRYAPRNHQEKILIAAISRPAPYILDPAAC